MSLITEHWEWDGFWSARRRGHSPGLAGHLSRGEAHVDEHQARHEVIVRPGFCVAWTASEGLCGEPAEGLACVKHAADFAPLDARRTRLTDEDMAYLATLPADQYAKAKNSLSMKRAREDPEYKDRINAKRRAMRAAGAWSS